MKEDTSTARLMAVEISRPGITEWIPDSLNIPGPVWVVDKKAVELLLYFGVTLNLVTRLRNGEWLSKTRLASRQDDRPFVVRIRGSASTYDLYPTWGVDKVEIDDNTRNRKWLQEHLPHLTLKPAATSSSPSDGS